MRWKGLIFLAVLVGVFSVISIFFMDQWIESGLESMGEAIVGAKVEIDNLRFSLLGLLIEWDRLQVTDPNHTMQNIIETGRTAFKMNAPALFRKRYVIEEMTLANVRSGTPRKYDGALPKKPEPPKKKDKPDAFDKIKAQLNREIDKLPLMNFDLDNIKRKLNLDSLIVMADLKMVGRIDSAKTDITTTAVRWEAFYKDFRPDQDLKKIRSDFSTIEPRRIKTLPELLSTLEKVKSTQKSLNSLRTTVTTKHKEIHEDFERITIYVKNIDDWFKEDFQKVLKKAKLPDLSVKNIGKILFGKTIVDRVNLYLDYLQTIRKYMPKKSDKPEKEKPPRMAGQVIYFPDRHGWPKFLIKKIHLSGQTGTSQEQPGLVMSGDATGITSQPWIYGRPTKIDLKGIQANKLSGIFAAVLDHTTEISSDSFNILFKNKSLNNMNIAKTPYLPSKISKGRADFNSIIRFEADNLLAQLDIKAHGLNFDFSKIETTNKFVEIVQNVISSMELITLHAKASGQANKLDFELDSNLDELISQRLKTIGTKALTDAQNKIRARLNQIRDEKLTEANKIYNEKRKEIVAKIDDYTKQVDDTKAQIEGKIKEIEDDIDKRKKKEQDKLKEKAKKALNGILKKKK